MAVRAAPGWVVKPVLDAADARTTHFRRKLRRRGFSHRNVRRGGAATAPAEFRSFANNAEDKGEEPPMTEDTVRARTRISPGGPRRRAEEVLEAAATVFAEMGFHGASTQDIADRLGMRQASLYYYFTSKEAALEEVCQRGIEHIIGDTEIIAIGPGSATERLAAIMRRHVEPLSNNCASLRAYLHEVRFLPKEARRRVGKLARRYERVVESLLEQGIASGELRRDLDVHVTGDTILGMCNAAAHWPGKEPSGAMKHVAEELIRLVLHGIATERSNPAAG
jgi:AcrR family transcriptional regulator